MRDSVWHRRLRAEKHTDKGEDEGICSENEESFPAFSPASAHCAGMLGSRKHVHGAGTGASYSGYLARPKLGAVRGIYSSRPLSTRLGTSTRKMKYRKSSAPSKMDSYKKRPDPVDTAYREAVGRLKVLLAESYTVPIGKRFQPDSGDDTDNQSLLSSRSRHSHHHYHRSSPFISRRYPYYSNNLPNKFEKSHTHTDYKTAPDIDRKDNPPEKWEEKQPAPEMMGFIQRQEDYIEQLEREAQFCRDELAGLLGKVKEVISENENLHEKQKSNLIKSVFDHLETETETEAELELSKSPRKSPRKSKRLEGPSIVFESRISELEAQLTQTKIELRKCQEENENYKRKIADGTIGDLSNFDSYKTQIDNLQREKNQLQEQVTKLQYELAALKERNNDTTHKIKRSLDVVEQAQFEKTQLEAEIRRLKDELDRQHDKLRETIHEQGRRIADERAAIERRYTQQVEQLSAELGVQWEAASKLQIELDKQRREDSDVKRDLASKQAHIEELRKEMMNKTAGLQSELAAAGAERGALEQQVSGLHLAVERAERQGKAEAARLQAEVQSLRQRLDRADADLLHSRRENLRLTEQVAALEKEINMNALLSEEKHRPSSSAAIVAEASKPLPLPPPKDREKELSSMIQDMEAKHVATVAELEGMIQSQNQLMEKLTSECHLLTQKLEDASNRHKEEIRELQTSLDYLSDKFKQQSHNVVQSSNSDEQHRAPETPPRTQHREGGEAESSGTPLTSSVPSHNTPEPSTTQTQPSPTTKPLTEPQPQPEIPEYYPEQPYPQEDQQYSQESQEYQQPAEYDQQYEQKQPDYPMDQQYVEDQQYTDQQYSDQQYYDENQQYVDQEYQQEYPMDQDYPAEYPDQQYTQEDQQQPYTTPTDQQQQSYTTPEDQQYSTAEDQQQYASQDQQQLPEQQNVVKTSKSPEMK